jgi:site-specific DNA-methyltransferase (adenine-specific)
MNVPTVIWAATILLIYFLQPRGWLYWNKGQDGLTMSDGELAWTTEDKPLRSKTINRAKLKEVFIPTQKPVEIMDFSIKYLKVPEKGAVLDLFAGSGTTAIACEKNNMRSYLMEFKPQKHIAMQIVKRMGRIRRQESRVVDRT